MQRGEARGARANPKQDGMSAKVLEMWVKETLADAEASEIPGTIATTGYKDALKRYGVDRQTFEQSGMDQETCDRIYRALFVYSVGFYELLQKCMEHADSKSKNVAALWRVFSILLETCCKADYKMLI